MEVLPGGAEAVGPVAAIWVTKKAASTGTGTAGQLARKRVPPLTTPQIQMKSLVILQEAPLFKIHIYPFWDFSGHPYYFDFLPSLRILFRVYQIPTNLRKKLRRFYTSDVYSRSRISSLFVAMLNPVDAELKVHLTRYMVYFDLN